ncbi:MAG: hypothetical protein ABSF92_03595 [Candidatus Acidiferrales bacterium]|jgi:hypothetical protein
MKSSSFIRTFALLGAIALAVPVFAKPTSRTINLTESAKLGASRLEAGQYTLLIDGDKVTAKHGKKVLAETHARWEEREDKQPYDSVLVGPDGSVLEIRFGGQRRVLVLSE